MKKYFYSIMAYLLAFFVAPYLTLNVLNIDNGFGIIIINLLLINSLTVLAVSISLTHKYGLDYLHILIMLALFSVSTYTIFNSSALIYNVFYLFFEVIGIFVGYYLRRKIV